MSRKARQTRQRRRIGLRIVRGLATDRDVQVMSFDTFNRKKLRSLDRWYQSMENMWFATDQDYVDFLCSRVVIHKGGKP